MTASSKTLTPDDFARAAAALAVPVAAIKAVTDVETRGSGFMSDGVRPVILFERHIMWRQVAAKFDRKKADQFAKLYPDVCNPSAGGYGKESEQPARMDRAATLIDRACALESASWGLFQIMGYHWKALGYASVQEFVNAMYRSEGAQLDAFVRFIKANSNLATALRNRNWAAFAAGYNGPGYKANRYDEKMAAAFARHSKELA
jgi:hypothetical protein